MQVISGSRDVDEQSRHEYNHLELKWKYFCHHIVKGVEKIILYSTEGAVSLPFWQEFI